MLAERAVEERGHAMVLSEFQVKRGATVKLPSQRTYEKIDGKDVSIDDLDNLMDGLKIMEGYEKALTGNLLKILEKAAGECENVTKKNCDTLTGNNNGDFIDFVIGANWESKGACKAPHLADLLESEYIPDQYKVTSSYTRTFQNLYSGRLRDSSMEKSI